MRVVSSTEGVPTSGSSGLRCHINSGVATVSALSGFSGGINSGNLVEIDVK